MSENTPAILPTSGLAITSLLSGGFGALLLFASQGPMNTITGLVAVACAIRAFMLIKRGEAGGRDMAIAGLILGIIATLGGLSSLPPETATRPATTTYSGGSTYSAPAYVTPASVAPTVTYPLTTFGAGTYLVSSEVMPGQYVTEGDSWCYWERARNTEGGLGSIIANGSAAGHTTVTVKSSDNAFKVVGRCTFTKR